MKTEERFSRSELVWGVLHSLPAGESATLEFLADWLDLTTGQVSDSLQKLRRKGVQIEVIPKSYRLRAREVNSCK